MTNAVSAVLPANESVRPCPAASPQTPGWRCSKVLHGLHGKALTVAENDLDHSDN